MSTARSAHSPTGRTGFTLRGAAREFWKHPSPWIIGATLSAALVARVAIGGWHITELVAPVALLTLFPFLEWVVHVFILHWRPKRFGRLRIDPLLAREHRRHHIDPRDVALIFIPWQSLLWVIPLVTAIALLAFRGLGPGLTFLVGIATLGLCYEWIHYLVHSDYKPKTRLYRAIWRNHRQHHFKNEHHWFTVTSYGTADRVLGTYPDIAKIETSPTAKNLHAIAVQPTAVGSARRILPSAEIP
ncbi:fatty acid hydroxylase family protein [Mycolicibacterium moriokaense]|nr:fatty acid hydroxylase family protein [Mycolicibacterium moriokaense]